MRGALVGSLGFVAIVVALFGYSTFLHDAVIQSGTATSTMATSSAQTAVKNIVRAASTTVDAVKDVVTPPENIWKRGIATVFWVGEDATTDNDFIHNSWSAWDVQWEEHYGGVDDPISRCGFQPCAFVPMENPFYVALPYNDLDDDGRKKANASRIPWNDPSAVKSVLKNRWIEVRHEGKVCFGQWQDVGPFEDDDIEYVFGNAPNPKNTLGEKAGIDLSPALADCLGVDGSDDVQWRHVESDQVPQGEWTKIITTRR